MDDMMTLGRPVLWEAMFRYMDGKVSWAPHKPGDEVGRWTGIGVRSTVRLKSSQLGVGKMTTSSGAVLGGTAPPTKLDRFVGSHHIAKATLLSP